MDITSSIQRGPISMAVPGRDTWSSATSQGMELETAGQGRTKQPVQRTGALARKLSSQTVG